MCYSAHMKAGGQFVFLHFYVLRGAKAVCQCLYMWNHLSTLGEMFLMLVNSILPLSIVMTSEIRGSGIEVTSYGCVTLDIIACQTVILVC